MLLRLQKLSYKSCKNNQKIMKNIFQRKCKIFFYKRKKTLLNSNVLISANGYIAHNKMNHIFNVSKYAMDILEAKNFLYDNQNLIISKDFIEYINTIYLISLLPIILQKLLEEFAVHLFEMYMFKKKH